MRSCLTMQLKQLNDGKIIKPTQRAQLTRLVLKLEQEQASAMRLEALPDRDPLPVIKAERPGENPVLRAIAYGTLFSMLILSLACLTWIWHDFKPLEIPDWKPVFTLAEVAREKGELYDAKELYSQAGRFAAWRDDWAGLLAAACGINKLEKRTVRYSPRESLLLRAMTAAERKQSRAGISAVGKAFTLLGEHELASVALSRIGKLWPAEDNDVADTALSDCWTGTASYKTDLSSE